MSRQTPTTWFRLTFPSLVAPEQVQLLLRALQGMSTPGRRDPFVLQTTAADGQIAHWLGVPTPRVGAFQAQAASTIPGLVLTAEAAPGVGRPQAVWRLWLSSGRRPLRADDPVGISRGLLAALSGVHAGEQVSVQWWLGPVRRPVAVATKHPGMSSESWAVALLRAPAIGPKELDSEARAALRRKQGEPGWRAVGRIAVQGATRARGHALLGGVLAAIRTAEGPGARLGVRPVFVGPTVRGRLPRVWNLALSVPELVGLAGWPLGPGVTAPVARRTTRLLPVPDVVPSRGRVVAVSPVGERPIALGVRDSLQHLHLVGPTGVGKSTVLLNLIVQDMTAGRGVVVIEPKGDLIADVLARVPASRRRDVVLLDPADERPVGINPLRGGTPELVADQLLSIFGQLHADSWGPRLSEVLHAALLTLARSPHGTLASLPLLLTNSRFRRRVLAGLDDPFGVGPFWAWFEGLSEGERASVIAPVHNKIRPLLVRPSLRGVVGQVTPRFAVSEVFTGRKIVLANLAKGSIGPESARLLGTVLVHQLWQATLGRAGIEPAHRHPVMVVIDEVQDYLGLPTGVSEILSQSRGLGVGWALAHQHLGQLPPDVRASVLANARSRVVFQVGADDAAVLARGQSEVTPADLTQLPVREAYLRLVADSEVTGYFSGKTLPPPPACSEPAELRRSSREAYGIPRSETDAALRALVDGSPSGAGVPVIGARRRPA